MKLTTSEYIRIMLANVIGLSEKQCGFDRISLGHLSYFAEKMIEFGVCERDTLYMMNKIDKDSMEWFILKQTLNYMRSTDDDHKSLFKPWEDK